MRPDQEINDIIQRINQGIASATDRSKFEAWYNSFDDSETIIDKDSSATVLKQSLWSGITRQLFNSHTTKSKLRRLYLSGAAAVILLCGVFLYNNDSNSRELSSSVRLLDENGNTNVIKSTLHDFLDSTKYVEIAKNAGDLNVRVLQTGSGELIKIQLPDGSKVSMNSNTKIQLRKDFGKEGNRIVYLDGEAFFDVAENKKQKFIVRTKDQSIEVLGTKFNVKSYAKQSETITALYEGKIQLLKDDYTVLVTPNEMVTNDGKNISKIAKDLTHTALWREMKFSFEDEYISDVIDQLSNWYGFHVEFNGEMPEQRISGTLEQNMELNDVILVLENLTGAKCKLNNKKLTIQFSK